MEYAGSNSYLQDGGGFIPLLSLSTFPRSQKREANLAAVVEVGVEADNPASRCTEVYLGRGMRIFGGEEDVELITAASVGRVFRPSQ